jgi:ATP-dependent RNA/DNA helicase IGHMBP2
MPVTDPDIKNLLYCIKLEEEEQVKRYSLDQQHTLKSLKAEGLSIHPISITKKKFGYADYPEITFRINFPTEVNQFKDGAAIECFCAGEEPVKGVLINFRRRRCSLNN